MPTSILSSTKKALGLPSDYDVFDQELIMFINSIFNVLTQVGVGPLEGFSISDAEKTWEEFTSNNEKLNMAQSYMYVRVRLIFDPPQTSFLLQALETIKNELEWRLSITADEIIHPFVEPILESW